MRSLVSGCDANRPFRSAWSLLRSSSRVEEVAERRGRVAGLLRQLDANLVGVELVAAIEGVLEDHVVGLVRELRRGTARGPTASRSVPSCTALFFLMALTVCLCATWPISWPSTPASSASFLIRPSAPRVMCTKPPGDANALTPSVSSTMNVQRQVRPLGLLREHRADERDVLVNRRILHDAEPLADLRADVLADLPLFLLGDRSGRRTSACAPAPAAPSARRRCRRAARDAGNADDASNRDESPESS